MASSSSSSEVVGYLTCLSPKDKCDYETGWSRAFFKNHACRTCRTIEPKLRCQGVDIWVAHSPGSPVLNFASPPCVYIARKDFMDLLQPEAGEAFHFGRVLDKNGKPLDRYITYMCEKPTPVRGKPYENTGHCDECGRFRYYPLPPPEGEQYVLADDVADRTICESSMGELLLKNELAGRLKGRGWPGIYTGKMPIRSSPIDGIDPFPENCVL